MVERNARLRERLALFEIGPVFLPSEAGKLPDEVYRLAIALMRAALPAGRGQPDAAMNFYDLKGILQALFDGLHAGVRYEPGEAPFPPGKVRPVRGADSRSAFWANCTRRCRPITSCPSTAAERPIQAAVLTLEALRSVAPERFAVQSVPPFPPVLEDLALIVDESLPAETVAEQIRLAGGSMLARAAPVRCLPRRANRPRKEEPGV